MRHAWTNCQNNFFNFLLCVPSCLPKHFIAWNVENQFALEFCCSTLHTKAESWPSLGRLLLPGRVLAGYQVSVTEKVKGRSQSRGPQTWVSLTKASPPLPGELVLDLFSFPTTSFLFLGGWMFCSSFPPTGRAWNVLGWFDYCMVTRKPKKSGLSTHWTNQPGVSPFLFLLWPWTFGSLNQVVIAQNVKLSLHHWNIFDNFQKSGHW